MDEIGIFAVTLVVALCVSVGFVVHLYPFDFTWEGQFSTSLLPEYDYIIVGGGTAGSVLANRLSENADVTVLLVEAGGLQNWISQVPLLSPLLQGTEFDWHFVTEPQEQSSFGLKDRTSIWHQGKGLGGSSLINYMVHLRGSSKDYDHWQTESACAEWSYAELLRYFVMSESVEQRSSADPVAVDLEKDDARGHDGPLHVQRNTDGCQRSNVCTVFLGSIEESGHVIGDLNANLEYGAMPSESNVFGGKRFSVYDGYIKSASNRSNLNVVLHAVVQKILFDVGPRASGVLLFRRDKLLTVRARREVIISAGSVNTPHLLLVSGVGSREELEKHDIPPIGTFLPVGENLRDHLSIPLYVHVENASGGLSTAAVFQVNTIMNFVLHQEGPLVKTGVAATARIPVPYCFNNTDDDPGTGCHRPGLLVFLLDVGSLDSSLYTRISNLEMSTFAEMFDVDSSMSSDGGGRAGFILLVMGTHPQSKGYVKLDTNYAALINPNYLKANEDVQVMSYGIRFVASLMNTPSMKSVGARLHVPQLSECNELEPNLEDDGFLECWLRTTAVTAYHPVGTCRMGVDKTAVVDCNLKVKGVENLRVVDASVMPSPLSASPAATVVAMAERAAKLIANEYSRV